MPFAPGSWLMPAPGAMGDDAYMIFLLASTCGLAMPPFT